MRKTLTSGALAVTLSLGVAGPALAQGNTGTDQGVQTEQKDDDSGKWGLLGLLGLGGLAGLARRDRDRGRDAVDARTQSPGVAR